MGAGDVRRRLADPALPKRLTRLGFAADDAADLLAAVAAVLTRTGDLELIGSLADRLVERIGTFGPSAQEGAAQEGAAQEVAAQEVAAQEGAADGPAESVWAGVADRTEGVDRGLTALLALLVSAPEVAAFHADRGVPPDISDATLADLGQQVGVHRLTYGEFGLHTQGWLAMVWTGALHRLGRLQFNLQPDPDGGWRLATHIPATGPLSPEAVTASLAAARPFFAAHFPDHPVTDVVCESWLLDPFLGQQLPESNLAAFQRRWELVGTPKPGDQDLLFFAFHRRGDVDVDALPTTTSLEQLAVTRLRAGAEWSVWTGRLRGLSTGSGPPTGSGNGRGGGVLTTLLPGFVGTTLPDWLALRLRNGLGGVCLFGPNIASGDQLRALTESIRAANPQAIIALDEEGGDVTRLYADVGAPSPGNAVLGRLDDLDVTRADAVRSGRELRRVGITVNFAPSVDVNTNAANPVIGVRSFGATADHVARHSAAWVSGLQSTGVAATAKHFPGHGDTAQDSHLALPVVDRSLAELRVRELVPFVAAIIAGVRVIMTSHILLPQVDPDNPATMSRAVLGDLLRGELGFTGVIVSDALDMAGAQRAGGLPEAAVRALSAGCDLLCLGTENTEAELTAIERAVDRAVADGTLETERIEEAAGRVRALASGLGSGAPPEVEPEPTEAIDPKSLVATFDVTPGARTWLETAGDYAVVRLETEPNMATGPTPWGPFAVVGDSDFVGRRQIMVPPGSSPVLTAHHDHVLVVGRDLHRYAFAREAVDRLRDDRDHVLVVEMGWPSDDRRYADVATFGSSRLLGEALLELLDQRDRDRDR